ncbi:hypothetical protein COEREDRAFT_12633 [Coemansia reversa NRRL 1564]|uniref:CCHC-type domain-containing protein n=1 Tax=Coemansia reversa (strain ATCC 12441 / NRRL 1564) TaxID=763665 RepID=A0A2G5B0K3_COERN|nr:hypothetical protein COEREDRAFT_12633 [Coemansia reversa NRRL 1564]|eukprot:PIA12539.1 hypothetical protein COEREDRAFT_12633 [Coemansia reversa NRRL 1564]
MSTPTYQKYMKAILAVNAFHSSVLEAISSNTADVNVLDNFVISGAFDQVFSLLCSTESRIESDPDFANKTDASAVANTSTQSTGKAGSSAIPKPRFTQNIGSNCGVRLVAHSKVEYNDAYRQEDRIDISTEITMVADVSHNHKMQCLDIAKERKVAAERLRKVSIYLNNGLDGSTIIGLMCATKEITTTAQQQECWRHIYASAENNSSIGSVGELENALAHIRNSNGMVKMAFDTIGNSTFPHVITWATADQLALAKTGIADVLAMGATYGILSCGMPVMQVVAKTATENLLPLVQAVVFNEQVETYHTLVQHILELVGITRVKTLFTDADSALIKAISEIPDVKHHLCIFYKRMNIRSAAGVVARDKKQANVINNLVNHGLIQAADGDTDLNVIFLDLCIQVFNKVIYMRDITNYNRMKQNLIESFPLSSQSRIRTVFNLEEHFVYLYTYTWRTHGWETSSAAESTHSALKHMLRQKSTNKLSFDDFVQQNYEFIEYCFAQANSNVQLNMSRKICTLPSQFIRESAGRITRGIAIDVYKSYTASKTEYVVAIKDENNIVLLGDIDPRWIFPENTSADIDTDIEDFDSDVSDMESLREMALSILDDILDRNITSQITHMENVLSFSRAMADQEHSTDTLQLPGVSMPQVKTKGRPKGQKITRDKTIAEKTLEECAQRDAQAKRKAPMPVNPDASTSASAKRSWKCSVCKQPGHNSRRCPNSNNSSE